MGKNRIIAAKAAEAKSAEIIEKIKIFLDEKVNRDRIQQIVEKRTDPALRSFFDAGDFFKLLTIQNKFELRKKLEEMREKALFYKMIMNFDLYGEVSHIEWGKDARETTKEIFVGYMGIETLLKNLDEIEAKWNRDEKTARGYRATALNHLSTEKREEWFLRALKKAPWGTMISVLSLKDLILLKTGELKKGKNFSSFRKEVVNNKR